MMMKLTMFLFTQLFLFVIAIGHICDAASIRCYKRNIEQYLQLPIHKASAIISSSCFDIHRPTVFYTFGYQGRANGRATQAVVKAYLQLGTHNVVVVNWQAEASPGMLPFALGYAIKAVPNAMKVGTDFGKLLVVLTKLGMNLRTSHFVGLSLGAHLMGQAGHTVQEYGLIMPRIVGLDPARALFESPARVYQPLDSSAARFVMILHTDAGGYGVRRAYGHVDIWPNGGVYQPGCSMDEQPRFSMADLCHHDRSWQLYKESLRYPNSFPVTPARNYREWHYAAAARAWSRNHKGTVLGLYTDSSARGNFFLTTNAISPYYRGRRGGEPNFRVV